MYRKNFEHILRDVIYNKSIKDETYMSLLENFHKPLIVATLGMATSFLFSGRLEFISVLVGVVAYASFLIYLNVMLVEMVYYKVWSLTRLLVTIYVIHLLLSIPFFVALFFKWGYITSAFK
jgi:hypothetical protein